jgi:hypothetical protein
MPTEKNPPTLTRSPRSALSTSGPTRQDRKPRGPGQVWARQSRQFDYGLVEVLTRMKPPVPPEQAAVNMRHGQIVDESEFTKIRPVLV